MRPFLLSRSHIRPLTLLGLTSLILLQAYSTTHFENSARWFVGTLLSQPVETAALRIEKLPDHVEIVTRGSIAHPLIYVQNRYPAPVEVEIYLIESSNVSTSMALPARVVVPAYSDMPVLSLWATDPKKPWYYLDSYHAVLGDPQQSPQLTYAYRLPFPSGTSFPVTQSFGGNFSHQVMESYHAVDFAMPEGTPIHAARAGIIVEANDTFSQGGIEDINYVNRANMIRILHEDGTMAIYAHLGHQSVQVTVGEKVQAGQWIARSGNTGYSTGPHLHFAVQRNIGMQLATVPFEFHTAHHAHIRPEEGAHLTAP